MGTQDKPAINHTHSRRSHSHGSCTISSVSTICLNLPINILTYHLPVSCVGRPQRKPLRWRVVRTNPATLAPNVGLLRPGRDTEGLPKAALEPPAAAEDSHLSTSSALNGSDGQRRPAEERGGSTATATGNRLQLASPGSSLEQPRPAAPLPGYQEPKAPCSRRRWGGSCLVALVEGGTYGLFQALREATSQLSGLLRAHPASPCNQLAQGHLRQLKQQPQASGLRDGGGGWGWRVTLGRCGGSGVWGVVFIFCLGMATLKIVQVFCRYGNPVESPVFVFCFFCLLGWGGGGVGEAGDSPQPQFGVGDMWRVYVECAVDGWFTASPGLSQTDWTLAGWGCTPVVHEHSWHPG